jgi:uncharacterized protein YbjT (DUF2867 family)
VPIHPLAERLRTGLLGRRNLQPRNAVATPADPRTRLPHGTPLLVFCAAENESDSRTSSDTARHRRRINSLGPSWVSVARSDWVYVLLALAIALLGAAASLPKSEIAGGLSASLLLRLVGATILLGLTIVYALG